MLSQGLSLVADDPELAVKPHPAESLGGKPKHADVNIVSLERHEISRHSRRVGSRLGPA